MEAGLRHYLVVTGGYWSFTVTDGAIRMLVVLFFHGLGYTPLEVASLFLFYELFGVVTNLVGGWLGARIGLNRTMHIGMALQVVALAALTVPEAWLTVPYVMAAQALSGIAKDLNKMSAKAAVKRVAGTGGDARLFRWVAALTGSKNALKGAGFFVGALLLESAGFRGALATLAALLLVTLLATVALLPGGLGRMRVKPRFAQLFSGVPAINRLSAARFFLFGARDLWFVVGLPLFLIDRLGWSFAEVGAFMALWVVGYGAVQAASPALLGGRRGPGAAQGWAFALASVPLVMVAALAAGGAEGPVVVGGLLLFGALFAVNSALHSFLILAYSDHDRVALDVGFYYMANAGGRLAGTLLSGLLYQLHGLAGCLAGSALFLLASGLLALALPPLERAAEG